MWEWWNKPLAKECLPSFFSFMYSNPKSLKGAIVTIAHGLISLKDAPSCLS